MHPQQQQAFRAFLIWSGASNLFFALITTVNLVYQFDVAHLTPLQLVLAGTILEITILVTQVPTGVIADVFSRRRAMIGGTFLVGFGFAVEGLFPNFGVIVMAQVIWGAGSTLLDGADAAWLADEVGEEHLEHAYLRAGQVAQALTLLAIPLSVTLGSFRLSAPVVLGGAFMMALAAAMPFFLPERVFRPPTRTERTTWSLMGHTLRQGIAVTRVNPTLRALMGIELFFGLASEGWGRLWQPFLLTRFALPRIGALGVIAWVGLAQIVAALIGIGLSQVIMRRRARNPQFTGVTLLVALHVARIAGIVAFALAGNIVMALLAFWVVGATQALGQPLYDARFARSATATVRATVISMRGLVNAAGQIIGGPAVGAVGNRSLRAALVVVAALLCPVFPLLARIGQHDAVADAIAMPQRVAPPV